MKKLIGLFSIIFLFSCNSQKAFQDYEYSYAKSGGKISAYENVLIKGNTLRYFYEKPEEKRKAKINISAEEKQKLKDAIHQNDLKNIREDYKKIYDNVTKTIKVKDANQNIFKNNGSGITKEHQQRWDNIVTEFENLINSKNLRK
ncbi:MAG: hypothetical protein Q4G16_05960 [Cruoricaptor ignavus]|nr:hypothetical protein [Cruoricaptor ignavus]